MILDHPDTPAAITVHGFALTAALCLAAAPDGVTTVCRYIARRKHLTVALAVFGIHLALVVIDESRKP